MGHTASTAVCLAFVFSWVLAAPLIAQENDEPVQGPEIDEGDETRQMGEAADSAFASEWEFSIYPYLWLPSVDGRNTIGPIEADVDASFRDIFDNFNVWGVSGRVEAQRDRLGLFLDGLHTSVDQEDTFSGAGVSARLGVDFELTTIELGASYAVLDRELDHGWPERFRLEGLAGARYTHYEQTLRVQGLGPAGLSGRLGGTAEWVEPFVGGRASLKVIDDVTLRVYGDAGGFGVGDADLTWKVRGLVDWQVSENISLLGGYQVYGLDFEEGSGAGRVGFDGEFFGPILGVGIRF